LGPGREPDRRGVRVRLRVRRCLEPGLVLPQLPVEPADVGTGLERTPGRVAARVVPATDQILGPVGIEVARGLPDVEIERHAASMLSRGLEAWRGSEQPGRRLRRATEPTLIRRAGMTSITPNG